MTTSIMVHDFMLHLNKIIYSEQDIKKEVLQSKIQNAFEEFVANVNSCRYKKKYSAKIISEAKDYINDITEDLDDVIQYLNSQPNPIRINKV